MLKDIIFSKKELFKTNTSGCIYLIKNPLTKLHKIGISSRVYDRIKNLSCQNGVDLEVRCIAEFLKSSEDGNHILIEKYLHEHYKEKRKKGEWFDLKENDVDEIIACLCMVDALIYE